MAPTSMTRAGNVIERFARAMCTTPCFERLPQTLEHAAAELRQLVEKQHAAVRQAQFAGPRIRAAADERDVRAGVMRRAKRPRANQAAARRQQAGDRVDRRDRAAPRRTDSAGNSPGSRRASIVLPAPGGPLSSR